jgi:hypothetical protein
MGMIPDELMPALQGVIPAELATSSASGEPNITFVSQVFYVDGDHVALSFQFFNKTIRNIRENPRAYVNVVHPETGEEWGMQVEYERSETEGPIFEQMDMQLEAIASTQGMADVFKLKAADIYRVKTIERENR